MQRSFARVLAGSAVAALALAGLVAGGSPAAAVAGGVSPPPPLQCVDNGTSGNRIQVLYTYEPGSDRFSVREAEIRQAAWEAQQNVNDSARQQGGQRWLRFLTGATGCQLTITKVAVPAGTTTATTDTLPAWLAGHGYNAGNRIYVAVPENVTPYCGATWMSDPVANDSSPGAGNLHNTNPIHIDYNLGCFNGHTLTHELAHALGGIMTGAPGRDNGSHCVDFNETLCQATAAQTPTAACPDPMNSRLWDCNHDAYFGVVPQGSWLPTHWNAAAHSLYLQAGSAVPALTTLTALPPQVIRAVDVQGTSVALTFHRPAWPGVNPPKPDPQYQILRNGTVVATIPDTAAVNTARITGLSPNTAYTFTMRTIVTVNGVARTGIGSQSLAVTTNSGTAAAGSPSTGGIFLFTNGVDMTMDDGYSSLADGNNILQYYRNEGDNQRWTATTAAGGTFTLTNKLSGKCLTVLGASTVAGAHLVQSTCAATTAQRWSFTSVGTGVFQIKTALNANLCVAPLNSSSGALTELYTATCNGSDQTQRWTTSQIG